MTDTNTLTVEEIKRLRPGEDDRDARRLVATDDLHRLCDMAARTAKAEEEADRLRRALDVVPGTPAPEHIAWAQAQLDKAQAAMPEEDTKLLSELSSPAYWLCAGLGGERNAPYRAAARIKELHVLIEAEHAARLKAEEERDDALAAIGANAFTAITAADGRAEAAEEYAVEATKAITGLTIGGSEFFVRHGDGYRADLPACVAHIRERIEGRQAFVLKTVKERKAAEARLAVAKGALERIAGQHWSAVDVDSRAASVAAEIINEMQRIATQALSSLTPEKGESRYCGICGYHMDNECPGHDDPPALDPVTVERALREFVMSQGHRAQLSTSTFVANSGDEMARAVIRALTSGASHGE